MPTFHEFSGKFSLRCADETRNSTIIPILHTSDIANAPEAINANSQNSGFQEDAGALIHQGSIVPKINFQMWARIANTALVTPDFVDSLVFNWMPLYFAFEDTYTASDGRTGTDVEAILAMQHQTGQRDGYPIYVNDMDGNPTNHPVSSEYTEVFGDFSLTTDLKLESVAFDSNLFWDAMNYYSNRSMLQKVAGQWHSVVVKKDHPYIYKSDNFTNPSVKRGNPYTFCGVLVHLPQDDDAHQLRQPGGLTNIVHMDFGFRVRYEEWNPNFDQSAQ